MENKKLMVNNIISNENIDFKKVEKASEIILDLQKELELLIKKDIGPFLAAIYDENENLIAKETNSVV